MNIRDFRSLVPTKAETSRENAKAVEELINEWLENGWLKPADQLHDGPFAKQYAEGVRGMALSLKQLAQDLQILPEEFEILQHSLGLSIGLAITEPAKQYKRFLEGSKVVSLINPDLQHVPAAPQNVHFGNKGLVSLQSVTLELGNNSDGQSDAVMGITYTLMSRKPDDDRSSDDDHEPDDDCNPLIHITLYVNLAGRPSRLTYKPLLHPNDVASYLMGKKPGDDLVSWSTMATKSTVTDEELGFDGAIEFWAKNLPELCSFVANLQKSLKETADTLNVHEQAD